MREIVLDTETTGLSPGHGDRVVEIGCLELMNFVPTGKTYHAYLDPERAMPAEALRVHGLTDEFLRGKPKFADVAQEFLAFIQDSKVIAHNADFDIGFLNSELARLDRGPIASEVIDSLRLARRKYPGAQVSLDALCRRFGIDTEERSVHHRALLDAHLLAQVYLELVGGRQPGLGLTAAGGGDAGRAEGTAQPSRPQREHAPSAAELAAHGECLKGLNQPIWLW